MYDFINPDHPAIRNLVLKLKDKKPVDSELWWIRKNISYGMGRCLDLELELGEPVALRKDYEVLKTREGICADQSFLLASLLRNRMPPESVRLVQVSTGNLYKDYLSQPDEIEDPFNHMCVAVTSKGKNEILDPTSGCRTEPGFSSICDDYAAFIRVYNQRTSGIVSGLRAGWTPLLLYNTAEGIFGHFRDDKFFRLYATLCLDVSDGRPVEIPCGYLEVWNMSPKTPEKEEEKYVKINKNKSLSDFPERNIDRKTRKQLRSHIQDRSFVDKLKRRLDRPDRDIAYV